MHCLNRIFIRTGCAALLGLMAWGFPASAETPPPPAFTISHASLPDAHPHHVLAENLKAQAPVAAIERTINELFILPKPLSLQFSDCEKTDATAEGTQATVCYPLVAALGADAQAIASAALFATIEESSDLLLSHLGVQVPEHRQNAVDELAVMLMLAAGNALDFQTQEALGQWILAMGREGATYHGTAYAERRPLSRERSYYLACLIHGSAPAEFVRLAGADLLPNELAQDCEARLNEAMDSWSHLMSPYLRPEPETPAAP